MRRTNLRGHALRGEGKPWQDNGEGGWMSAPWNEGHALCECGETSGWIWSDTARRKWHARHKDEMRPGGSEGEGK
jgi:hypothetical protein